MWICREFGEWEGTVDLRSRRTRSAGTASISSSAPLPAELSAGVAA